MIIILKRDDLLPEYRDQAVENLELNHFKPSSELIEQAELIVFVEGTGIKFLNFSSIQSKNSFDVFMRYITSTSPKARIPYSKKRIKWHKKKK